jgi:hypothetical protein
MDLGDIMDGLATALATISGLQVYGYPPDSVTTPAAVVALPDTITYDDTMARGADRITIPVHVLVGKVSDRSAAAALAGYLSGAGTSSVKAAVESDATLGGAADTARVTEASVSVMTVAGVDLLAASFSIDVVA